MNINKAFLIDEVSKMLDGNKSQAEKVVVGIFEKITETLKSGYEVSIAGFGIWSVKDRAARQARNPRTGELVNVPATKVVKFRPSKTLKEAVKP